MRNVLWWGFLALILMTAISCRKAPPDWSGTWRLDESESSIPGPTLTVAITQSGEYHTDMGGNVGDFRCDGKGYPAIADITAFCLQRSSSALEIVLKKGGTEIGTAQWELSHDGGTLIIGSTSLQPGGPPKAKRTVYVRISGSAGFAGGWKSTTPLQAMPSVLLLTLSDHKLHYAFPEKSQYSDLTLDGSDAAVNGSGVAPGSTMAMKYSKPQELLVTKKLNGQIVNLGILRISTDGHTLTETYWRPQNPEEKAVIVYERQ
jgi:hypothetical protein